MSRITEQDTKLIAFWNEHYSGIDQKNLDKTSLVNCKDALNLYNKLYNNERPSILGFMQSSENVGAKIAKKEGLSPCLQGHQLRMTTTLTPHTSHSPEKDIVLQLRTWSHSNYIHLKNHA